MLYKFHHDQKDQYFELELLNQQDYYVYLINNYVIDL